MAGLWPWFPGGIIWPATMAEPCMTRSTMALRSMAMEMALRTRQSRIGLGTRGLPALSVTSSTTERPTLGHMWMMRFDGPLHTFTLGFDLRSGAS